MILLASCLIEPLAGEPEPRWRTTWGFDRLRQYNKKTLDVEENVDAPAAFDWPVVSTLQILAKTFSSQSQRLALRYQPILFHTTPAGSSRSIIDQPKLKQIVMSKHLGNLAQEK